MNTPRDRSGKRGLPRTLRLFAGVLGAGLGIALIAPPVAAQALLARAELAPIEVVASTPVSALALPIAMVPANVQTLGTSDFENPPTADLADLLQRSLGGVVASQAQGNPYQSDLGFRGFAASPLAGTPQGLSVFLDGVRINEVFGDTVNWDLLPPNAIARVTLLPGSAPAFGLNTLGGALALETRDGRSDEGLEARIEAGSFGRLHLSTAFGAQSEAHDLFLALNHLDEAGWREHSLSRIDQGYAKLGWQREARELNLTMLIAETRLEGAQTLPLDMLAQPRSAYTWPDRSENRLVFLSARGISRLTDGRRWDALAYWRRLDSRNIASNLNHDFDFTSAISLRNAEGSLDRARTLSDALGASLQWSDPNPLFSHANRLQLGLSLDTGRAGFRQWSAAGTFTDERTLRVLGDEETAVDVATRHRYLGAFFNDTFSLDAHWHLTAAARWNEAQVALHDRSGNDPALEGRHRYHHFNPALGLSYTPSDRSSAYLAYNEGMRIATPMELSCADPAAPCKLPNAFLADPPLRAVVARTMESGWRLAPTSGVHLRLAAFRTEIADDIVFVASNGVNSGYFQNVPRTRRQGLETHFDAHFDALRLSADYSYTEASFASALWLPSPANSTADAQGRIVISPGNRLPGVPAHKLLLRAEYSKAHWQIGASLSAFSTQYARGDENNRDAHGPLAGYALCNLDARYALGRGWELLARLDNAFDRRYETLGVLGENFFRGPAGRFAAELASPTQFRAPGSARGLFLALRFSWAKGPEGRSPLDVD